MNIGILGTGTVGATLGTKLVEVGHHVRMGSRTESNARAAEWVAAVGSGASAGTFADAAACGDVELNCTAGAASLEAVVSGDDPAARAQVAEWLGEWFGWPRENIIDLGGIATARGTEMILRLWVGLMGALGTATFNWRVVRAMVPAS